MRKNVFGKKLKRDKNERTALFKNLMSSLILHERIETTQAKAKAIKPQVEKLVTKALKGGNASMKVLYSSISSVAVNKLVSDIAPRFSTRKGGYTRIINLGNRFGDQAPMVVLEWVEKAKAVTVLKPQSKKLSIRQAQDKSQKVTEKKSVKKETVKKVVTKKTSAKKVKGKAK